MTDEQLEKQISEEFEKWEKSCDSYELRKSYDAEVEKRFEVNKKNPNHINEEDALQASRAEAWGKEAFKAAALPLMKKIEEFKETPVWLVFENSKWIEKENEELEEHKIILNNRIDVLQKENEELKQYKEMWQSIAGKANLQNLVKENEELRVQASNCTDSNQAISIENHELREALDWLCHEFIPSKAYQESKMKEIRTKLNLNVTTNELLPTTKNSSSDKEGGK